MPELPDITLYIDSLGERIVGRRLEEVRLVSPFLLRTAEPAPAEACGSRVAELRRLGKRIAIGFDNGTLELTEAGTNKRASLHVVCQGELRAQDPGGLEIDAIDAEQFRRALQSENHTLKRALTDPRVFSGIGNAYSDEILHRARLSPVALTSKLTAQECRRLFDATVDVLREWTQRLRADNAGRFPAKVTAFHEQMAVHGRFGLPCPVCSTKVQRIRYTAHETNYCPRCQTGGRLLADRSLSRLLKQDWPRSVEELEKLRG